MAYRTLWEVNGVYWFYSGVVTEKEVIDSNNDFYKNPKSVTCHYQIIDGLCVEQFDFNKDTMVDLAALDSSHAVTGVTLKLAFVANNSQVLSTFKTYIKYSRMLHNQWEMEIFDNLPDARIWLESQ